MAHDGRLPAQLVGAFGEKLVEAELLRRGRLTANVNASVINAARFDIFAQKGNDVIPIQVKACGPGSRAFSFSCFPPRQKAAENEFTVLVKMGKTRKADQIFVIPTCVLHEHIEQFRNAAIKAEIKDVGMWDLRLPDGSPKKSYLQDKYGFARKWEKWLDNWDQLEPERLSADTESNSVAAG
jgi:hypothetical protein